MFFCVNISFGEWITLCPKKTFTEQSGTLCTLTLQPGEDIYLEASYQDDDTYDGSIVRVFMDPNPANAFFNAYLKPGESVTLHKYVYPQDKKTVSIKFYNYDWGTYDYVTIKIYSERTNLRALPPSVNLETGDLYFPWDVNTSTPFNPPVGGIAAQYWVSPYYNVLGQWFGYEWMNPCYGKSYCYHKGTTLFKDRKPIPFGSNYIVSQVDPDDKHAEIFENDNLISTDLGTYIHEKIPGIMMNYNSNWSLPSTLMSQWLSAPALQKPQIPGVSWDIPVSVPGDVHWFLDPTHSNFLVRDRYKTLKANFLSAAGMKELKNVVMANFAAKPGKTKVLLSEQWQPGESVLTYHKQHINSLKAQTQDEIFKDVVENHNFDAATAAFGNFTFYLVPRGTATKEPGNKIRINLNKIAIHVVDSFDFNSAQAFGFGLACWKEPNGLNPVATVGGQYTCVNNEEFRNYRKKKARAGDYTVFVKPVIEDLPVPMEFYLP